LVTSLSERPVQKTPFLCCVCNRYYVDELFTVS
jgi:hypothetical protein